MSIQKIFLKNRVIERPELDSLLLLAKAKLPHTDAFVLPVSHDLDSLLMVIAAWERRSCFLPISADANREEILKLNSEISKLSNPSVRMLIRSSGSSGSPKIVAYSQDCLANAAKMHQVQYGLSSEHVWLASLPFFTIGGMSVITRADYLNQGIACNEQVSLEEFLDAIKFPLEGISLVPTQLQKLIRANKLGLLKKIRVILVGGAELRESIRSQMIGLNLVVSYGMSETCGQIYANGACLPEVKVKIGGDQRILVSSPSLSLGYLKNGKIEGLPKTEDAFFITDDLGTIDEHGKLNFLGRADEVVNSGGIKISPEEVEQILIEIPGIEEACVTGIDDEYWGQKLVAGIKIRSSELFDRAALEGHLRQKLGPKKVPKEFYLIDEIPRNANGKIVRKMLKDWIKNKPLKILGS